MLIGQKSPVRPLPDYVPFANDHKCVVPKRHHQNVQASDLSFECPRLIQCKPKRKNAADHGELGEDSQFVCKHLLNFVGSRPTSSCGLAVADCALSSFFVKLFSLAESSGQIGNRLHCLNAAAWRKAHGFDRSASPRLARGLFALQRFGNRCKQEIQSYLRCHVLPENHWRKLIRLLP